MQEMIEPVAATSWDDLFADLGLPPEKPAAPATAEPPALEAAPEPTAAEPEPTEEAEAPPARGRRRRSPPAAVVEPEEEPAATEPAEPPAALAIETTEVSVPCEVPAFEAGGGEAPAVEGEEEAPAPRGRSRRRRRGRGSKSAAAKETTPVEPGSEAPAEGLAISAVEASEAPPATESDEDSERQPRRRRSRGRAPQRSEAPRVAVNENEDMPSNAREEELEPAGREDEIDDLSNWNVPSWAELIGSLYRPDR